MGFGRGRGFGRGFGGGGWGWRNRFYATGVPGWMGFGGGYAAPYYPAPNAETEKQALKSEADAIRSELEAVEKRLAELEAGAASK
jgi:hypothetical protein